MTSAPLHKVLSSQDVVHTAEGILKLTREDVVAWDTETTGLDLYAGDFCTGISLAITPGRPTGPLEGLYVPVGHKRGNVEPGAVRQLVGALAATDATQLLWHATFDWAVINNLGHGDVRSKRTVDGQVVRWLQDENQPKALKTVGEILVDEDAGAEKRALNEAKASWWENQTQAYQAVREAYPELPVKTARAMAREMRRARDWGDLTVEELAPYAARDATLTTECVDILCGLDEVVDPSPTLAREMEVNHICFDMTARGVSADHEQLTVAEKLYRDRAEEIAVEMDEAFGNDVRAFTGGRERLNLGSAPQVAALLFDVLGLPVQSRTEGGAPSTDKNALERLQGDKHAAAVLAYRHWVKAAGSYAAPFARFLELAPDGRIHGMYDTVRTVTGRLSASNPNVMTIPREDTLPEIRAAFYKVPPGIERLGFDLASAELWVMASITGDPVLTSALLEGRSLHIETMKALFNTDDKSSRFYTLSKNINYGIPYGAGVDQIAIYAAKVGYGPEESYHVAGRALRAHKRTYRRQHQMSDFLAEKARSLGKLPLGWKGRYRHFVSPGAMVPFYTALNALVQGGVAEFMKDTMREVYARGYGELLVLQVHDELVFDAPRGMKAELHALLTGISNDINPFKHVLTWEGKAWSAQSSD